MMENQFSYTDRHHKLKNAFLNPDERIALPDTYRRFNWMKFSSVIPDRLGPDEGERVAGANKEDLDLDHTIRENLEFSFPVFMGNDSQKQDNPIILLHGLNERSWIKYLVWADYLAEHTGRPVMLFPLAYHMNRSPSAWADPRVMTQLLDSRKLKSGNVNCASFVNVALSERLTYDPLRFLVSGHQSASDVVQLVKRLRVGSIEGIHAGGKIDFFCYSIGAFLGEILFLADPDGILSDSRLFLFCGGSFFEDMQGTSRLIMDQLAFETIHHYFLSELDEDARKSGSLTDLMRSDLGKAFSAMISERNQVEFRKERKNQLKERMLTMALENDHVIPASGIRKAMSQGHEMEILDFPYDYTHESPFPILKNSASGLVDKAFEKIFSKASAFLND